MRGKASVVVVLLLLGMSQTGLALLPFLVQHAPVALLVLRPQPEMMVLVTPSLSPVVIVLVAAPLRLLIHVAYYELGRWGGEGVVSRTRAGAWALKALSRKWIGATLLISCLLHQSTPVDMALGARGTARRNVEPALAFGVSLSSVLIVWLGIQLTPFSASVLEFFREHRLATAIAVGTLAVVGFLVSGRQVLKATKTVGEEPVRENDN